jgi:hypothetical protein
VPDRQPISLRATITPDRLPADAACDVVLRLVLRNDGTVPVPLALELAKLDAISSYAGVGVTWSIKFDDPAGAASPIQELRTWYGPPGNPPPPSIVDARAVGLAPGAETSAEFAACWIPNAQLEPRHLEPAALDPQGMDNVAPPSRYAGLPTLGERVPLARASVLVLAPTWKSLADARAADGFLRGHVVAFFGAPGTYQLRAQFWQSSHTDPASSVHAVAEPVAVAVG